MITVKQIHDDFETAQDRIVKEAQRIIDSHHPELIERANRLKSIGFPSAKDAVIGTQYQLNIENKKGVLESINYFKQKYPFNKFITEEEVERLCKKYGLVLSDSSNYIGEIPEKNISDIENFKLDECDYYTNQSFFSANLEIMLWRSFAVGTQSESEETESNTKKPPFKIVAPLKDFKTPNYKLNGHKLELNLPDPIVLQPVKNGYLIVTKWGEEAGDEIVVNSIEN